MASFHKNVIVSEVIKSKSEIPDDEPKKKSREDWRKAKELEEARKAGTAPAAVDEEGKDINPHIPQYISSTPWYYGASGPTLKHQRIQPDNVPKYAGIDEWYKRGVNEESRAKKWRKGACENCGAMTHKRKDCMERPRARPARYTNSQIAADEFIQPVLNQSYDGKRDRWAGYDPIQHKTIVEHYQKIEEAKRQLRAEKLSKETKEGEDNEEEEVDDEEEDEDKYVDDFDMPGTKVDSKQRITVRNLRIREDTAKYLRNLDLGSAFYDPKTRSMRDNPHVNKDAEEVDYAGENFVRFTGDTQKHATAQLFAWEAYEKGVDVHLLAEPTKLELLKKEYEEKKNELNHRVKENILKKYGGEEHLDVPPKELLLAQTEDYREYTRYGKLVKGEEKLNVISRYEEDVHPLNHTSIWGSFWSNGEWGYKCCHSLVKNSYCTGEAGKNAAVITAVASTFADAKKQTKSVSSSSSSSSSSDSSSSSSSSSSDSEEDTTKKKKEGKSKKKKSRKMKKKKNKESKEGIDDEKLKEALLKEDNLKFTQTDDRKRKYNSMYEIKKPSEEEMEAYYMKRSRDFDPMA